MSSSYRGDFYAVRICILGFTGKLTLNAVFLFAMEKFSKMINIALRHNFRRRYRFLFSLYLHKLGLKQLIISLYQRPPKLQLLYQNKTSSARLYPQFIPDKTMSGFYFSLDDREQILYNQKESHLQKTRCCFS